MKLTRLFLARARSMFVFLCSLHAVAGASLDAGFDAGARANGDIVALARQSDGRILVGGDFTTINSTARSGIARLNPDGSIDASFQIAGGAAGTVYAIAVQPDGRILLGGAFTSFHGAAQQYVVRLNTNGTVDPTFHPTNHINGSVRVMVVQPDGRVLGGEFHLDFIWVDAEPQPKKHGQSCPPPSPQRRRDAANRTTQPSHRGLGRRA